MGILTNPLLDYMHKHSFGPYIMGVFSFFVLEFLSFNPFLF